MELDASLIFAIYVIYQFSCGAPIRVMPSSSLLCRCCSTYETVGLWVCDPHQYPACHLTYVAQPTHKILKYLPTGMKIFDICQDAEVSESLLQQGTPEDNISLLASITGSTPIPLGNYYSRNLGKGFKSRQSRNGKYLLGLLAEN